MNFLDGTTHFHEKLRLYFYPKIFEKQAVATENWDQWEVESYTEKSDMDWVWLVAPLLGFCLLFIFLGYNTLRKSFH